MSIHVYGIPNCDTVKKARKWLDAQGIEYVFHDYKKEGADRLKLERWVEAKGWEVVLNRRGTTFRKLPEDEKADMDAARAVAVMENHVSTIKRPVVEHPGGLLVGFTEKEWEAALF
ncbi:Spx/MgsR family transcriptional regulator [Altererythrobacter atlanticus]|uniref:Regulatory protein Spx n=1 Tax=Croceibacterium atlanticum TaxID=1267766 RepID=A0A0F7KUX5_9SPHN|nr:arsenate reductase [Croceibacterium atlanticum]AKH42976.1 Regulatory protein Spx [Croceibacterium atlanticum]MBB5734067.1 Spx/MgsR family transcriptional regulator [Croceibacterium atlanticum]